MHIDIEKRKVCVQKVKANRNSNGFNKIKLIGRRERVNMKAGRNCGCEGQKREESK